MPLVVPGLQSNDGDKTSGWMDKLMGKKLGDSHNETVKCFHPRVFVQALKIRQTFAKTDLPQQHRVLKGDDQMMTMDHNPDRLNIHTSEDGTVNKVTHG
ncbi:Hypothetical predicted protein [Lecanosticta acicola]|uniref:Uncharacterized protein n=1 Tax=Lecanosticta acicola TaxID=111012 RepID=A0AAI9EDE9_9PEZI|nr:Hypothetical predicted protein [Lecanosticta acicola]